MRFLNAPVSKELQLSSFEKTKTEISILVASQERYCPMEAMRCSSTWADVQTLLTCLCKVRSQSMVKPKFNLACEFDI